MMMATSEGYYIVVRLWKFWLPIHYTHLLPTTESIPSMKNICRGSHNQKAILLLQELEYDFDSKGF